MDKVRVGGYEEGPRVDDRSLDLSAMETGRDLQRAAKDCCAIVG